jgi:hypothetical protein
MTHVPAPYLKQLAEDREIFNELPSAVKQQARSALLLPPILPSSQITSPRPGSVTAITTMRLHNPAPTRLSTCLPFCMYAF